MRHHLLGLTESSRFQRIVLIAILAAAVSVGLATFPGFERRYRPLLSVVDSLVLAIFTIEILARLAEFWPRPHRFFRDGWNTFDFVIVAACFVPATGQFAAVFRLFRLLRVLRLISTVSRLQFLVTAMLRSLPSMAYVMLLLLLLFYVYAVMGVFLFARNDPESFGTLWVSLLTLFEVVTLEGWVDLMDAQRQGHPGDPPPLPGAEPLPLVAPLYFVSFVLLGTMVMLNLVIGVIINAMDEAQRETASRALDDFLARAPGQQDPAEKREHEIRLLRQQLETISRRLERLR